MPVVEFAADSRTLLYPLFRSNRYDTVIMRSTLEGRFGSACADSTTTPSVARLDSGAFTILGGDPQAAAALALIRHRTISYVTPESAEWRELLEEEFEDILIPLSFTEFSADSLDSDHLKELAHELADEFEFSYVDRSLAERLSSDLKNEYFLEHFDSTDDFLDRGLGCCILHDGVIVSAATSIAMCTGAIDIEIETASAYRNMGLGTVVGAQLLLQCLESDIEPHWLAATDESERLANRLGCVKILSYQTF